MLNHDDVTIDDPRGGVMPFRTITAQQLRELADDIAREHGEDAPIAFTADYGDYHHTVQVFGLSGETEEFEIRPERGYSQSGWAIIDNRDEFDEPQFGIEDDEDMTPRVVVLSASRGGRR